MYNVYAPQGGTLKCQALYDVIARHVEGHGKPFVIAGDHNNKKDEVQHMWKESEAKREMVVISTSEPTCKTPNGDSTIGFFVVDTLLAQATGAIALLDLHALKTHTPVVLTFTEAALEQKVKVFKAVKSGTPDRKIGPQQLMEDTPWDSCLAKIEGIRVCATITSTEIDSLAEEWEAAAHLEAEVLFDRMERAGGAFTFKETTLRKALCTKESDRATPSFAVEHFIRKMKEYKAAANKGDKQGMAGVWRSWTRKATTEFYGKHLKGNEDAKERLAELQCMITASWNDGQHWCRELEDKMDKLQGYQLELVKEEWKTNEANWKLWIDESLKGGGGKAHRFAKDRDVQQHKLAENNSGELSLGITHGLEEQVRKWTKVWEGKSQIWTGYRSLLWIS